MPPFRKPRAGLDRNTIVQAAAQIVNAEGPEALTINRLARDLGVRPPSLYNHIDSLAGLWSDLALLNATALSDRLMKTCIGKSGPDAIKALANAYRGYIQQFPGLYQASLRASRNAKPIDPRLRSVEDQVVRVVQDVIESFGILGNDAIHAVRGLRSLVHGFATLEAAGGFGLALSLDESFERLVEVFIRGLENQVINEVNQSQ